MEWLWGEWAEGVLCGAIGVYVHVQEGGPGLYQGTGGDVACYPGECGGEHGLCGWRESEG